MAAARPGARAGDRLRASARGSPLRPAAGNRSRSSAPRHRAKSSFERARSSRARLPDVSLDRLLDMAGERAEQPRAPQAVVAGPRLLAAAHGPGRTPTERLGDVLGLMRSSPPRSAMVRATAGTGPSRGR